MHCNIQGDPSAWIYRYSVIFSYEPRVYNNTIKAILRSTTFNWQIIVILFKSLLFVDVLVYNILTVFKLSIQILYHT